MKLTSTDEQPSKETDLVLLYVPVPVHHQHLHRLHEHLAQDRASFKIESLVYQILLILSRIILTSAKNHLL